MIAELRLYRHQGHAARREAVDVIRIQVTDSDPLKALDGVLEMAKVHRERMAKDKDATRTTQVDEDEDEDEI